MKLFNDLEHSIDIFVEIEPIINFGEQTPKSFFNYDENELINYLDSYPHFNSSELVPVDTTGYDFMTLEKYRYQKMIELLPSYLLLNVHGFYIEHLHYLNSFLNINFGSSRYLLEVGEFYYDLELKEFVSIVDYEIDTYKIIYNHNFYKKISSSSGVDSNGYEINKYDLIFQIDITQFLDVFTDISTVPVVPMPSYTEEQAQLLPSDFLSLLEDYNQQFYYTGDSKNFYRLLERKPFFNPLKEYPLRVGGYDLHPVKANLLYTSTGTIDQIKFFDFPNFGWRYNFSIGQVIGSSYPEVVILNSIVHNFFNPYEWFFFFPVKKGLSASCHIKSDGEKICSGDLNTVVHEYVVYRYRQPYYEKFNDFSNLDDLYGVPKEPTNKKCCLFDIFKTK